MVIAETRMHWVSGSAESLPVQPPAIEPPALLSAF